MLIAQIKNMVDIDESLYDYADTLTPYGLDVRYPNELFLEERHAKQDLEYINAIMSWVKTIISEE